MTFNAGDRVRNRHGHEGTVIRSSTADDGREFVTYGYIGSNTTGTEPIEYNGEIRLTLVARAVYLDDEDRFMFEQIRSSFIAAGDGPLRERLDQFLARADA